MLADGRYRSPANLLRIVDQGSVSDHAHRYFSGNANIPSRWTTASSDVPSQASTSLLALQSYHPDAMHFSFFIPSLIYKTEQQLVCSKPNPNFLYLCRDRKVRPLSTSKILSLCDETFFHMKAAGSNSRNGRVKT